MGVVAPGEKKIYIYTKENKGKGRVHHMTCHEGPKGNHKYGSTLSLTSALDGGGG